jgi:hypothetical protein
MFVIENRHHTFEAAITVTVFWYVTLCEPIEIYQYPEECIAAYIFGEMETAHSRLHGVTSQKMVIFTE